MIEAPHISVDDIHLIQVLVCHLIYSLGCPLTREQLIEITSLEQAVNYFDLIEALNGIEERLCTTQIIDGELAYLNTRLGDSAAMELGDSLPVSIREKLFEEAVKVYTRDAVKKERSYAVRYAENDNGSCTVGITFRSETTGRSKYYIGIQADNRQQAEMIKEKIKSDPDSLRDYLDKFLESE